MFCSLASNVTSLPFGQVAVKFCLPWASLQMVTLFTINPENDIFYEAK